MSGHPPPPPIKITKLWDFFAILVWISWNTTKLPSQHSMLGHDRRFAGWPMVGRFKLYLDPLYPLPSSTKKIYVYEKNLSQLDPLWQKLLDPRVFYSEGATCIFHQKLHFSDTYMVKPGEISTVIYHGNCIRNIHVWTLFPGLFYINFVYEKEVTKLIACTYTHVRLFNWLYMYTYIILKFSYIYLFVLYVCNTTGAWSSVLISPI